MSYSIQIPTSTPVSVDVEGTGSRDVKTSAVRKLFFGTEERVSATANGATINGILFATDDIVGFSDERLKNNVQTLENVLDNLQFVRGVSFEWKQSMISTYGVIAQEVEIGFPDAVYKDENGYLSVSQPAMIGILVEAINELNLKVKSQERLISKLEKKINNLELKNNIID